MFCSDGVLGGCVLFRNITLGGKQGGEEGLILWIINRTGFE
jgi:hypothetical protein